MTTLLGLLLSVSLLSTPQQKGGKVSENGTVAQVAQSTTQTVQNYTADNVGTVTVMEINGTKDYVNVPGQGTFSTNVSTCVNAAIINGQAIAPGTVTWVRISEHTAVHVNWTSPIIIIDQDEQI